MKENNESQELSFFDDNDSKTFVPLKVENLVKRNNPVFYNTKKSILKTTNQILNVLSSSKNNNKLELNEEFQNYLALDQTNSNLNIVTFLGSKQVGKSFLVDFIISREEKSASRIMTTEGKPLLNMPTFEIKGRNGEKVVLLDSYEELPNDAFIWAYFLSSVFVLNLYSPDQKGEDLFIDQLKSLKIKIENEMDELSLPQLVIIRRDLESKTPEKKQFLQRIQELRLFQGDIVTLKLNYPGSEDIQSKDITHVTENALNKKFVQDVENVQMIVKSAKTKSIKGNYMGSKIVGLIVEPLTKSINKDGKVSVDKIWNDVIETLSVGYYNYYIKKYSEELQNEFQDEEPCDKYSLYKKLTKVRRTVDKKVEGFSNIAGDPIFEKYKEKLKEKIDGKEKIIKDINKQKSKNSNNELCKHLFAQMNDSNCEQLIQKYCQSPLDDQKADVLLNNFEEVVNQRVQEMEKSKNPAKKQSKQILVLEEELKKVEEQIQQQKKGNMTVVSYDFDEMKKSIQQKEKEVRELEVELQKQKKISSEKKLNQNKDIVELENNIESLKSKTKDQERHIDKLRLEKDAQVKETIENLNSRLKEEEEKYRKLQDEARRIQSTSQVVGGKANAKAGAKDTCCEVM